MGEELVNTLGIFMDEEHVEALTHTIKQVLQGHDVKATDPDRYARFEAIMDKRGMTLEHIARQSDVSAHG